MEVVQSPWLLHLYETTVPDKENHILMSTIDSDNLFLTTASQQKLMAEMANIANDPEMSAYMLRMFNETLRCMTEMMVAKQSKPGDFQQGDVVSSLIRIDKGRKLSVGRSTSNNTPKLKRRSDC
jgi:hypothetical protein